MTFFLTLKEQRELNKQQTTNTTQTQHTQTQHTQTQTQNTKRIKPPLFYDSPLRGTSL